MIYCANFGYHFCDKIFLFVEQLKFPKYLVIGIMESIQVKECSTIFILSNLVVDRILQNKLSG